MHQSVIYAAASAPAEPVVSVPVSDACCDLLELFPEVADGRVGQGRDHPAGAVLAKVESCLVTRTGWRLGRTATPVPAFTRELRTSA